MVNTRSTLKGFSRSHEHEMVSGRIEIKVFVTVAGPMCIINWVE